MSFHRVWLRVAAILVLVGLLTSCSGRSPDTIVVGSKNFPEQALLGEILAQHLEARTHLRVERRFYLAGSYICQQALLAGRIDTYVEYTGTALTAILHDPIEADPAAVFQKVQTEYGKRFTLDVLPSLGFNNTFAIVVRGEDARRLHLASLTDAAPYTRGWRAGFGYEFMERPDGYPGLASAYGLHFSEAPRVMDLGLLAPALKNHQIDLAAGNATDGLIFALDLFVLDDDRHYFPPYEAVAVVRQETLHEHPEVAQALAELGGKISDDEMRKMNYALDGEHRDAKDVAREFLSSKGLIPQN